MFHDVIEIVEGDGTVTTRRMNPNGGFYPMEEMVYDDDLNSFELGDNNEMSFVDALEEDEFDDEIGDRSNIDLLQGNRQVHK